MKPVLYYTLARPYYSGDFKILAVTSETLRSRVFGRYEDNSPTHTTKRMTIGKFQTFAAAEYAIEIITELRDKRDEETAPLEAQINKIREKCQKKIDELFK